MLALRRAAVQLRSDMLFLLLAKDVERRLLVLAARDVFDLCVKEQQEGRGPNEIEQLAELPEDLAASLRVAQAAALREVSRMLTGTLPCRPEPPRRSFSGARDAGRGTRVRWAGRIHLLGRS